jgi:cysteinyl-tRNA synthetase
MLGINARIERGCSPMVWIHRRFTAPAFLQVGLCLLLLAVGTGASKCTSLNLVHSWAYQIQGLDSQGAADALVNSPYDMLVIEPTRSAKGSEDFDTAGLVARLHERGKLVLAYLDIGEAEDYRLDWRDDWRPPRRRAAGEPDFLVTVDPGGWSGNYPVAYWDQRWKDIVIYGEGSLLDMVLDDGFDGVYLDWIEAFNDPSVTAAAAAQGFDPAVEMVQFVREVGQYARERRPGFVVVAQNGADLAEEVPQYLEVIDGLAQEDLSYGGAADTEWGDPESGDIPTPEEDRLYLMALLEIYRQAGIPLFCVDYALQPKHVEESYRRHREAGCLGYVSQTPLSRLTETPPPQ